MKQTADDMTQPYEPNVKTRGANCAARPFMIIQGLLRTAPAECLFVAVACVAWMFFMSPAGSMERAHTVSIQEGA